MGILSWVILGLFAGTIAQMIVPRKGDPEGCIATLAIGILGALLGGFLATSLDIGQIEDFFDFGTWLIAIGGAVLLLLILRGLSGGKR